jgi:hypothetical protein
MDPLAQAMQMLQEAQQIIAMLAEEVQTLRQQGKKPEDGMQKKASVSCEKIAMILGVREQDIPDFVKLASEDEVRNFMSTVEVRARQTTIGKIAQIDDGSQADSPAEQLESALSALIS